MDSQFNITKVLDGHKLVPVVTFDGSFSATDFADYLNQIDVHCIEVTLRTKQGMSTIEQLKKERPKLLVGAGTVIDTHQVDQLHNIGVDFIVSPGLSPQLVTAFQEKEIPFLPGVATPSEVMQARDMGLGALKFFPANFYGGSDMIKNFSRLFSGMVFCPTGGISSSSSQEYLKLDNVFAVGGSWFQKDFEQLNK